MVGALQLENNLFHMGNACSICNCAMLCFFTSKAMSSLLVIVSWHQNMHQDAHIHWVNQLPKLQFVMKEPLPLGVPSFIYVRMGDSGRSNPWNPSNHFQPLWAPLRAWNSTSNLMSKESKFRRRWFLKQDKQGIEGHPEMSFIASLCHPLPSFALIL